LALFNIIGFIVASAKGKDIRTLAVIIARVDQINMEISKF